MAYLYAKFNNTNLPIQFSYEPYIPEKRNTVTQTANCIVVQSPRTTQIYNTTQPVLYDFLGYWGEQFRVYFTQLDQPTVKSRLFSVSGFFQVMCATQHFTDTGDRAMKCSGGFTS